MELQNTDNYVYYECRSSLACYSGGTVYDTSTKCDNSVNKNTSFQYSPKLKNKNIEDEKSLVDLTTHLDDDKFNDFKEQSNIFSKIDGEIKTLDFKEMLKCIQKQEFEFCSSQDNKINSQDLIYQILDNYNTRINENIDYNKNCSNANNIISFNSVDDSLKSKNYSTQQSTNLEENKFQYLYLLNSSNNNESMGQGNNECNVYSQSVTTELGFNEKHMQKRKQIYTIKNDSVTELLDKSNKKLTKISVNDKNKKKKLITNKENKKCKLWYQNENPFGHVKMNSILKKNKKQENKSKVSCNTSSDVLQEINTIIQLNAEFTNADYLEYVQPREQVIESNMDKLLTPTVEIELTKVYDVKVSEDQQVDFNGNKVDCQDIKKLNNSRVELSSNEIVERELILRSVRAKKLGFGNCFNTSNDSVLNEILFDETSAYQEIKLDSNIVYEAEKKSEKNISSTHSFKSISCSLMESLNEIDQFGELEEEKPKLKVDNQIIVSETTNFPSNKPQKEDANSNIKSEITKESNQVNSDLIFNFFNKSNLLGVQSNYGSLEYLNEAVVDTKKPTSFKIKIKRINDEKNEYVIDCLTEQNEKINKKTVHKYVKNIERYECNDCLEKFRTKKILIKHVSEYHRGPYDMECNICHMKYKKCSAHKKHEPWCTKNIKFKCHLCSKEYCYKTSLQKHLKLHHREKCPSFVKVSAENQYIITKN